MKLWYYTTWLLNQNLPVTVTINLAHKFKNINPIFDGVWCRCHTLQLLKHNYSKMIHPTHTIIPYIWSHEYPLRLEPNFFFFKISIVFELYNLWRSERKQPIKNRVKQFKKAELDKNTLWYGYVIIINHFSKEQTNLILSRQKSIRNLFCTRDAIYGVKNPYSPTSPITPTFGPSLTLQ